MHESALTHDALCAEPEDAGFGAGSHPLRHIIVRVKDEGVFRGLVGEDTLFCSHIVFKGAVAVEVVRRDI